MKWIRFCLRDMIQPQVVHQLRIIIFLCTCVAMCVCPLPPGISWILYNLAKFPEHQEKCRQEVDAIFDEKGAIEW